MNISAQKGQPDEKCKQKIFKKKNILPKIANINRQQNKFYKTEKFSKNKNKIKQILSKYGLSMYLKKFYDLNYDFYNIGLLNQNGFNNLVKTLKIYPGHLVRMENLYNYIKNNINEFKIEKSHSVEKPKTANGSKIKNKTFYNNNNNNNNFLKINRPFTTFYNYNKINKKKYKSLNKREINKNSFNIKIYHENNKILQSIINKNFNINNYNNKQNKSEIDKNYSNNKYYLNAENDILNSENIDLLLKFYMQKLNNKLEESYSTVHDSTLSEINLSKNNTNNIINNSKNKNNNNNIKLNFKNKLPEINKTKAINNNNEEKKNNSNKNCIDNNSKTTNFKNNNIKNDNIETKTKSKNNIEEIKNNEIILDKIKDKKDETKNPYKKKLNNNNNNNKIDYKQLILTEFKKNENETNSKNINHKTILIKNSPQNENNNNNKIEEEIIEEKITDSDKKIASKYNNKNNDDKDNKDILNVLSNEEISSILNSQKNSIQKELKNNQKINNQENSAKKESSISESINNNNNKEGVEEETEMDKEFLEKFSAEEDIYSNIRLNKSDDFTYIYQELDYFDVEYMCRCLGLCLMYLIENSFNKEHIVDLNYKIKFLNKNLNEIQNFFKNFNPNKIVTNLENLIKKNNKPDNLIKFHNKKKFNDIEKDIKFIDEFFTVQKKNKKYENLSEKAKNLLSKELSFINEVNSEMSNNTTKNNIVINEINEYDNKNESLIKEEQEENIKTEENINNNNIDKLTEINNLNNNNENNNIENSNNINPNNNNNTEISNNQTEISNNTKEEKVIFDLLKNLDKPSEKELRDFFLKQGEIYDDDYLFQYKVIPKKKPIQFPDPQTIFEFCANIMILCKFHKDVILLCLIYIEKLIYNTGILLTHRNWRRLIFTSMLIANKYLDEESIDNYMIVKIFPHLKLNEVNLLEEKFLEMINFQTFVGLKEYFMSYFIIKSIALKYNWNGSKLVKIDVEKMMKIQEYAYIMQKKMKKNIKRTNSI